MATQLMSSKSAPISSEALLGLSRLGSRGFQLTEVRVSPVSALRGRILSSVRLPEGCRVLCLSRKGETMVDCEDMFLMPGDTLYVLTDNEEMARRFFLF
jgi:Trk K+ transport system NAD-binding subunit